ncbi:unnamed protein product, partial [Nesidiocoris tenuis]
VGMMWSIIKTLYNGDDAEDAAQFKSGQAGSVKQHQLPKIKEEANPTSGSSSSDMVVPVTQPTLNGLKTNGHTVPNETDRRYHRRPNVGSGDAQESVGDFFFGDAEMDPLSMEFEINHLDGLISQVTMKPSIDLADLVRCLSY